MSLVRGPSYTGNSCFIEESTLTDAMHTAVRDMLDSQHPDAILNIETHHFNVIILAHSCEYELDIGKELWLNQSRWTRLTREYIASDSLEAFINGAATILAGEARDGACVGMLFNDPRRMAKKHRWGGCLQSATFRGDASNNPTLTFYSRTSYIGYMGMMDAAIAYVIAREIADQFEDLDVSHIAFRWYLTSAQLHHFKSLPFIYSQFDLHKKLKGRWAREKDKSPAWRHIIRWHQKVEDAWAQYQDPELMLANEKYGPFRRIKRRWLEHQGHLTKNIPPSLMPAKLDFTKCLPYGAQYEDIESDDET